jgi:hypothetical protein
VTGGNKSFHHGRHRWLSLLARDRKLTRAAIVVAVVIWDRMNASRGYAWPSLSYFQRELALHRQTVVRAIHLLADRGWITIDRGNRRRSNRYRIAFGLSGIDDHETNAATDGSRINTTRVVAAAHQT